MFPLEGSGTHLNRPDPPLHRFFPPSHLLLLTTTIIYHLHNPPLPWSTHLWVDSVTPCWSLASTPPSPSPECPNGAEQDSGALRLPQDPALESNVLGRACRGSRVEQICGQNQCIGTLMERSNRFGNFTFSSFSPGTIRRPHRRRKKTTATKPSGKRGLLISTASGTKHDTVNNHSFSGRRPTCYTLQCVTSCCSS